MSSSLDNDEGTGGAANHISGNKTGWEKTESHSEPRAWEDPGDQIGRRFVRQPAHCRKGDTDPHCLPHQEPHGHHHPTPTPCLAPGAESGQALAQEGADVSIFLSCLMKSKIKIAVSLKMNPVNICLPPPCSIGQFVNMYTESYLAWEKVERKRKDLLLGRTDFHQNFHQ